MAPIVWASSVVPGNGAAPEGAAPRPGPVRPPPRPDNHLPPPFGLTTRVSEPPGGGDAAGPSAEASISADGRYVAFSSFAADLVDGDTNNSLDVFVRDRVTGETIRLPIDGREFGAPGGRASEPSISPDGAFVAFTYRRPAPGNATLDAPVQPIVLLWDSGSNATRIASVDRAGRPAFGSFEPDVSDQGRYVAYTSTNASIAPGDNNGETDVFRVDTSTGLTTMISQTPSSTSPRGASREPAICADGSVVAFTSDAPNVLIPDPVPTPVPQPDPTPTPESTDELTYSPRDITLAAYRPSRIQAAAPTASGLPDQVYARSVSFGITELVSQRLEGGRGAGASSGPAISAACDTIAFVSFGMDLVPGDFDSAGDIYVRERSFNRTTLLTGDLPDAGHVDISGNSRIVVFASATNPAVDGVEVYHRDRLDGETIHISVAVDGGAGGDNNLGPVVSEEGDTVAWTSTSGRLILSDGNDLGDVFARDLPPAGTISPTLLDFGTRATGTTAPPGAATFTSIGWRPIGPLTAAIVGGDVGDFDLAFDGCTGQILPRPLACTMTVLFTPLDAGPRASTLRIIASGTGGIFTVRLLGAGSDAELTVTPPIGPPGIVTIAEGRNFPPNTEVILDWTPGIDDVRATVVTDDVGAFRAQVLVFHHDIEGPRDLEARPGAGTAFPPIAVSFFVSKPTTSPPRFDPAAGLFFR